MYPRQPFDFAGRTGTIVFGVSNDTQGSHSAWPELWVTDQPVPDPFTHEASWQSLPRNGFGIRFAGCTDSSGDGATCTIGQAGVGVDSAITVKNYVGNDSFSGGTLKVIGYGSVTKSRPGQMNHYEIRVSQSQIEVYGTDAYSGRLNLAATPLVHLATIPNVNLGFTRGLVWLEDVHYNGDKFNTERLNTFHWSNLGFDGPVLPRDLGFDVPDDSAPLNNATGIGLPGIGTAWVVHPNSSMNLTVQGVTGVRAASGALLTYNFYPEGSPHQPRLALPGPHGRQSSYHRHPGSAGRRRYWQQHRDVLVRQLQPRRDEHRPDPSRSRRDHSVLRRRSPADGPGLPSDTPTV
jgi:hypothetical protein